ncbi:MAG: molybdopterin-guanine dinucleotide biosynthesis protein B [bacterium]
MIPVIGITGTSGVGKTELLISLIKELRNRGYQVAAIKHTYHQVDIDRPGKDSHKMFQAGARAVGLASKNQLAAYMETDEQQDPRDIAVKMFPRVDLVLVEGFKDAPIPRIGVLRKEVSPETPDKKGLIAMVSDMETDPAVPGFGFDDISDIAELLEKHINKKSPRRDVSLFVNGSRVMIKPFIKDLFLKTVSAMVGTLKGTGDARRIEIVIDKPGGPSEEED